MAKEKFNIGNLLPQKPQVVKPAEPQVEPARLETAVESIHRTAPAAPETRQVEPEPEPPTTPSGTKKVSFDLPVEFYRFIKLHCLDRDISMREYLLTLIAEDYARRGGGNK
jgi:hypothetical protein